MASLLQSDIVGKLGHIMLCQFDVFISFIWVMKKFKEVLANLLSTCSGLKYLVIAKFQVFVDISSYRKMYKSRVVLLEKTGKHKSL